MLVAKTFTIGDSWYLTASHVTSGRTGLLIPDAVLVGTIVDKLTRVEVLPPTNLVLVDPITATFEAIVPKTVSVTNNTQYIINVAVTHGGVTTKVSYEATAILDNVHAPNINVSVPAQFTIGDDLSFRALNVRDAKGNPHLGEVLYELLDRLTREVIAVGSMTLYDAANSHYEAVIDSSLTNVDRNNEYVLHVIVKSAVDTTASAYLCATVDSITK